jgi:hypothetical protein
VRSSKWSPHDTQAATQNKALKRQPSFRDYIQKSRLFRCRRFSFGNRGTITKLLFIGKILQANETMGLFTATVFTGVLVVGVTIGSPAVLGLIGLSAVGPVAGGAFAAAQGAGVAAGTWMAAAQSIAMVAASPTP